MRRASTTRPAADGRSIVRAMSPRHRYRSPRRRLRFPSVLSRAMPTHRLDESIAFVPVRIAVMTVSDTRSEADDVSGDTLAKRITDAGHELAARKIVRDDQGAIARQLKEWIADPSI